MVSEDVKVAILAKMRDAKAILFGELSSALTFEMKEKAWKEILDYGKGIGLIKQDKSYQYFRDKMYGQWKQRTLKKMDKRNATGRGGGKGMKLTPVDEIILDIVGRDSPLVKGIGVDETRVGEPSRQSDGIEDGNSNSGDESILDLVNHDDANEPSTSANSNPIMPSASNNTSTPKTPKQFNSIQQSIKELALKKGNADQALKRKRLDLQIDVLRLEKRKRLLEIFDLEERLGVAHEASTLEQLGFNQRNPEVD